MGFGNSSEKVRKSRYQSFLVLSNFTEFLYPPQNTLIKIIVASVALLDWFDGMIFTGFSITWLDPF